MRFEISFGKGNLLKGIPLFLSEISDINSSTSMSTFSPVSRTVTWNLPDSTSLSPITNI